MVIDPVMRKPQPWLISYEYQPEPGRAVRSVELINVTPWKFVAQFARRNDAVITAIFWAVQIPVGGLSDEEVDLLS